MKTVLNNDINSKTKYRLFLKKDKNQGATMIVAIIVVAVLMVFAFSLILVTYSFYSSQNKKVASKKCSEAANSLSVAMVTELEDDEAYNNSDFWLYLRFNLFQNDWTFYEPKIDEHNASKAVKTFEMKANPNYYLDSGESNLVGYPGLVKLKVYWMLPKKMYDDCNNDMNIIGGVDPTKLSANDRKDARLFIEITCESASQSYTVTNEYHLTLDKYDDNDIEGDKKIITMFDTVYSENELYNPNNCTIDSIEKWDWVFDKRK